MNGRVAWGQALVLLGLAGLAVALLRWQAQPWPAPSADTARLAWAAGLSAAYVVAVARGAWGRRPRPAAPAPGDAVRVVFASQTGQAEQLAGQTAASLHAAGVPAHVLPLAELDAATLAGAGRILFVASTTGEGDAPDAAGGFVRRVMASPARFDGLAYGVLALGDRDYDNYCAFGRQLDQWLQHQGARPLFDRVEVDNGDPGALRHWQHHLRQLAGGGELPDWEPPVYATWTLARRELLNPGSLGGPCFHLELQPPPGPVPDWSAGDIAEIGPRQAPEDVAAFLAACGLPADARVRVQDEWRRLGERLAECLLPPPAPGADPQALADTLQPLPHREYSIASLPADGALHLLVRRQPRADGRPGLASGWLTAHAPVGAGIALRLRRNTGFHPPADDRPLLLVGNGTGLAGLRALLKARLAAGHRRNWLLFGERQQAVDDFHGAEIRAWAARGDIEVLDTVWSRDGGGARYVQDRLRERASLLREWVAAGAAVYVCGSLEGMAPGVHAALVDVLGEAAVEDLAGTGRYRRDVY